MQLPQGLLAETEAVARRILGRVSGPHELAQAVAAVSQAYTRERDEIDARARGPAALEARLRFFLPRDLPKVTRPLRELAAAGRLPQGRSWRALDLGAGLGTTTLGVAFVGSTLGAEAIDVVAVDRDAEALEVFRALAEAAPRLALPAIRATTHVADLATFESDARFDFVLVGLAVNELATSTETLAAEIERWARFLAPSGQVILLEPALRSTARTLQELRGHLIDRGSLRVLAPCLHEGPCPLLERERDWCHDEIDATLPEPLAAIARDAGLRFERLTQSYLVLGASGPTLAEALPVAHGRRLRVVGAPRATKGQLEVFVCEAGPVRRLVRLDRDEGPGNAVVEELGRGDVVDVEGGSPRGERLRADRTSVVRRVRIGARPGPAET